MHARTITAAARPDGETIHLTSPAPGLFHSALRAGDVVRPGSVLGELEVLGQRIAVIAPATAAGAIVAVRDPALARPAVDFGAVLVTVDPRASGSTVAATAVTAAATTAVTGLVFRAPTSGRFYGRSNPGKPPFVTAGTELVQGTTICLLEVMKTFHRVTYGGEGLPERARVERVLVIDGEDVGAGDPLLALSPGS
jgi:acetyl-CoA carboxylase biotin carboxyl carrier protein